MKRNSKDRDAEVKLQVKLEVLEDRWAPAAAALLQDIAAGAEFSNPVEFTKVGNVAFFAARNSANGEELWKTDGTVAGTVLVKDINAGAAGSRPRLLTAVGNTLFFVANDGINGRELWKSDGTPAGTNMIANLSAGSESSNNIRNQIAAGGKLFFTIGRDSDGRELWVSDGAAVGTKRVRDINPGTGNGIEQVAFMAECNGVLYFSATNGADGFELWKSDGTTAGTVQVLDLVIGPGSSHPRHLTTVGTDLYFVSGVNVYRTNGVPGNVTALTSAPSGASPVAWIAAAEGTTYFARLQVGAAPAELWKTDGTPSGTELVAILPVGSPTNGSMNPLPPTVLDHRIQFQFDDGVHGVEPWISDGTAAGTRLLRDIRTGSGSSSVPLSGIVSLTGAVQVVAPPPSVLLNQFNTATPVIFVERTNLYMLTGSFTPNASGVGFYDSTAALRDDHIPLGTMVDSYYLHFDPVGNPPDFNTTGSITFDREIIGIYCRDDRLNNTDAVFGNPGTIYPTNLNYRQIDLDEDADNFTLSGDRRTIAFDLYTSEFIDAMRIVTRAAHRTAGVGGNAYFVANDGVAGDELWRSDGTPEGTNMVHDVEPGPASGALSGVIGFGSHLLFRGQQEAVGVEPFIVDAVAPKVVGVWFDNAAWSPTFRSTVGTADGYAAQVGGSQLTPMPWSGMHIVRIRFSEPVIVDAAALRIAGIETTEYAISGFTYESATRTAVWQLAAGFGTDRLLLDLDGDGATAVVDLAGNPLEGRWSEGASNFPTLGGWGSDFHYRFVVAVGDADRNGVVRNADLNLVRGNLFIDAGQPGYNPFTDVDGNGQVRNADLNAVRGRLFIDPPAGPGPNRPIGRGAGRRHCGRPPAIVPTLTSTQRTTASTDTTDRSVRIRRPAAIRAALRLDAAFESEAFRDFIL